ncbi:unnamed protein product [Penicillium egyptiacum]|uniref:Uncharacterized protein n=1 Tax=Penicillium egyptiacum TaxID=1303716 RepID=A0A9W4P2A6_9EURO|nr:unnamed protein product [Penicillium egyptiacum]
MESEEVVRRIDFRYTTDVITPEETIEMLKERQKGKEARPQEALENRAVPAYTTSPGWLAFSGDRMRDVLEETIAAEYTTFKFKVGTMLKLIGNVWSQ